MGYKLKDGQALVIVGPQGCGKSTAARAIAEKYGNFVEIDAVQLETNRGLNDVMSTDPKTIIVDGFPMSEDAAARLKALIAGESVIVNKKHMPPEIVKTPRFIFCSGDPDCLPIGADDRRFVVLSVAEAAG